MLARILGHIRQQYAGFLALAIVLGGTSYAAATGSIDSREIKNNTVRSKDVRNHSLTGKDVRDRSLLAADFKPGQLPSGPAGPRGLTGPTGSRGVAGPGGAQGRAGILDAIGRSTHNPFRCIPGDDLPGDRTEPDPSDCGTTTNVTLPRRARVLLLGDTDWATYSSGPASGLCTFAVDGAVPPGAPKTEPGERDTGDIEFSSGIDGTFLGHAGISWVTPPLDAGTHTFSLRCGNTNPKMAFFSPTVSAVAISPD